jgi:hypothetical protein
VNLDVFYNSGEPEVLSAAQGNGAVVRFGARQVSQGLWLADIGQSGPFAAPRRRRDGVGGVGGAGPAVRPRRRLLDPAVDSSTPPSTPRPRRRFLDRRSLAHRRRSRREPDHHGDGQGRTSPRDRHRVGRIGCDGHRQDRDADPMPLTLAPGASGTVTVEITPSGAAGSVVTGHLYIDTANLVTVAGDELISLPGKYTVH